AGGEQVRDAVGEYTRLAGAGPGDHEQRALGREDGLALGFVQVGEVGIGLYGGHPITLESRSHPKEVPNGHVCRPPELDRAGDQELQGLDQARLGGPRRNAEGRRHPQGHLLDDRCVRHRLPLRGKRRRVARGGAAQAGLGRKRPHDDDARLLANRIRRDRQPGRLTTTSSSAGSSQATAAASAAASADLSTTSTSGPSGRKRGYEPIVTCGQRTVAPVRSWTISLSRVRYARRHPEIGTSPRSWSAYASNIASIS